MMFASRFYRALVIAFGIAALWGGVSRTQGSIRAEGALRRGQPVQQQGPFAIGELSRPARWAGGLLTGFHADLPPHLSAADQRYVLVDR